jgi:exopolysaccharide biosynthesis protein
LARTAIGVDRDGHRLIIIVVDGRQSDWSIGITLPELARRMIDAGANDAINLDGGGSSSFVFQPDDTNQAIITNRPCDESAAGKPGVFRPVAVQLGFGIK